MRKIFSRFIALFLFVAVMLMYVPVTYAGTGTRYDFHRINFAREITSAIFFFLPATTRINLLLTIPGGGFFRTTGDLDSLRVADGD